MTASTEAGPGSGPYYELEITKIVQETHDTCSVVLAIPSALQSTFAYRAGQFLTFSVTIQGHHLVRCYSLASSPDTESEHKVTIKRVEDGRVSNWLHDSLSVGDHLQVMKPAGHFCLQERDTPIVLFGGGSGITPIISLVKTAMATTGRSAHLVYANRDADSVIFAAELEALAAKYGDRFRLDQRLDPVDGLLSVEDARAIVTGAAEADFYVCGPGPYMDVVEEALRAESVPEQRIFIERFLSPELVALDTEPAGDLGQTTSTVEVYLDGELRPVACHEGETILAAAHRAGLDAPCACMEGYCGACMAMVKEGDVDMKMNDGGVDDGQIAEGWVLTCQGVPRPGKVRVDYPDPD
jgi:3-ketosteroid 9alpha-monooxygenase subunit B